MNDWEYMQVAVHHREDGNLDFVAKRESAVPSIATHQEMRGHFNIPSEEWDAYLQKLKDEGWEVEQINHHDQGQNATYYFKRIKE